MSARTPEARVRKSARQRERRMAQPGYGHGAGLTVAEREARREAYLAVLGKPEGPGWRDRAACINAGPALFAEPDSADGGPGESPDQRAAREREAKAFCRRCPVRAECLADAVAGDDRVTVRGGMNAMERRLAAREAAA